MLSKINKLRSQKGSMMVEAIAMLGLIAMVTPVIYKKAAERTNEMQDINAASQVRTIVNAIDNYLRDNYITITSGGTVTSNSATAHQSVNYGSYDFGAGASDTSVKTTAPINIEHFRDYLPLGFKSDGKVFNDFQVIIKQTRDPSGERKALTSIMVAKPNDKNPDMSRIRSSRIASMIGTNGGFFDGNKATGVQGVWEIPKADLPNSSSIKDGSIVATSVESVSDGTGSSSNVLHRIEVPGRPEYNTMEVTLHMGGYPIDQLQDLIASEANSNTINIRAQTGSDNATLHVDGQGLIDSTLKAAGENFIVEAGYAQHKEALYVGTGNTPEDAKFMVTGDTGSIKALEGKFNVDLSGSNPYMELSGAAGNTVLNANENLVSFMDQNVMITPDGNTDIAGYTHITGDISAADGKFTANDTEAHFYNNTLNILDTRNVNIGTADNIANLRVYGSASIDDLNVENNFKAGNINGSGKYGFNVAATSGDITINSNVVANNSGGDKIFDIGDTKANTTYAKQLIAGGYDSSRGGIGLVADESGATVRFKDGSSSFLVKDTADNNQLEMTPGETIISSGTSQIATFNSNTSGATQAKFTADVAVYDGTGTGSGNVLTISQNNADGTNMENGRGSVHIRRGVIELDRNADSADNQANPRSYVKADRFISNVSDSSADKTNSLDSAETYDFEVNPAYTSMMNDIKLASRGGARLSDILPDFINKGIYVLDNTYTGSSDWSTASVGADLTLTGLSECSSIDCDTSPWLGFIPTPNCPPGYSQVATITPIRFAMAQTGVPETDSSVENKEYRKMSYRFDPRGDQVSVGPTSDDASSYNKISSPLVIVSDNDPSSPTGGYSFAINGAKQSKTPYWADMLNTPYTFQINTWLNTTLKAYYHDGRFQGWHGIMGFIYPALSYEAYAKDIGVLTGTVTNNTIIWNLFPVRKEELSAIATIYCYFNRGNFSDTYVDKYLPHAQTIGNIRYQEKPSGPDYNDPNLNYNGVW